MIICSKPECQTTAGCKCKSDVPKFGKSLSDYTDDEIAREYHARALARLGDPRISITLAAQ